MTVCCIHKNFFDDTCTECRKEYAELKGLHEINNNDNDNNTTRNHKPATSSNGVSGNNKKMQQQQQQQQELSKYYKEFTEERAKKLYEDLLLQFLRSGKYNEFEASQKARSIIRKQCLLRNMPFWPWLN